MNRGAIRPTLAWTPLARFFTGAAMRPSHVCVCVCVIITEAFFIWYSLVPGATRARTHGGAHVRGITTPVRLLGPRHAARRAFRGPHSARCDEERLQDLEGRRGNRIHENLGA